jgi:hypothetical protein
MALNRISRSPEVYDIAARWRSECLVGDGSLFSPGAAVWTRAVIEDLYERFVERPDLSKDTFLVKFARQLEGAPTETCQLAAEALYVHLLPSMNTTGANKRIIIETVLGWAPSHVDIPPDLGGALDNGLYGTGTGFNTHRPDFLRYVLELARLIKRLDPEARRRRLSDPWEFRALVYEAPAKGAPSQRDSILHLLFPEHYETIASMDAKNEILACWPDLVGDTDANVDRQLYEVRQALTPKYGKDFDFWDEAIIRLWRPPGEVKRWDAFIGWAKELLATGRLDSEERTYKLTIGAQLAAVRTAIEHGEEGWHASLKAVFSGRDYNLTSFWAHGRFLDWAKDHEEEAGERLLALWRSPDPAGDGFREFTERVPAAAFRGSPVALVSVLLMGADAVAYPPYAASAVKPAMRLAGVTEPASGLDAPEVYGQALAFFDAILEEASSRGMSLRDRLDAQSIAWWITKGKVPAEWPDGKQQKFLAYRGGTEAEPEGELVEPYARIFADYDEAQWAFGLMAHIADRLGLTGPDDPRYSVVLRYRDRGLHFSFCNWLIAGFYARDLRDSRISLTLLQESDEFGDLTGVSGFKVKPGEPNAGLAYLPMETVRGMSDGQLSELDASLDFTADHFAAQRACPWRRSHVPELGKAIWDEAYRARLLTGEAEGAAPKEYSLAQMASETGFPEAELKSWVEALRRKKQAILFGPPGTGKTYVARRLARFLAANDEAGDGLVELVQFHPAYAYEDFIQGIRPQADEDGNLSYELERGRFLDFVDRARGRRGTCVLIIDEINRANLARVFGELMYLLEYRDDEIALASGGTLHIPGNVLLIGTMNTADRSIALVDHALRRRFAFLELQPKYAVLERFHRDNETGFPVTDLLAILGKVNAQIRNPHYFVGISFFLDEQLVDTIESVWRTEIYPYLDEYFFDQPNVTAQFTWEAVGPQLGSA